MGHGVGGILKLTGDEAAGCRLGDLFRLGDGTGHALGAGGQYHFRAVGGHQFLAFDAHGVGHDDDAFVAPQGGHQGKSDAGIAGGRLNDGGAGL